MRKIWISSASMALAFAAIPAHAADIEFSFEGGRNPWSTTAEAGTVKGILYGLDYNGVSSPTGIRLTSLPGGAPSKSYTLQPQGRATPTGLTLDHGVVTDAKYNMWLKDERGYIYELDLNTPSTMGGANALFRVTPAGKLQILGNAGGFSGARYSLVSAAVPEPAAWMLMILGFGIISYTLRQRKVRFTGAQLA